MERLDIHLHRRLTGRRRQEITNIKPTICLTIIRNDIRTRRQETTPDCNSLSRDMSRLREIKDGIQVLQESRVVGRKVDIVAIDDENNGGTYTN